MVPRTRLAAQLLVGSTAKTALEVVERLLAIQGQDPKGARLAVRARTKGLHVSDVDRELTDSRALVVTTLNRGTLHLVRSEDYWWLQALTTPPVRTSNATRLAQEGVTPSLAAKAVKVISKTIADDGPCTRPQLRARLQAAGIPVAGQALPHLFMHAALQGVVVRGPMVGGQQAFVLVEEWLGKPPRVLAREVALAEMARRFLVGHGPADDRDLAKWAGVTLSDARSGLRSIGRTLVELPGGLVDLAARAPVAGSPKPKPKLLGPFDPVLFGWVSREPILGDMTSIVTVNGLFRAFAMVRGVAVATWTMPRGKVELSSTSPLSRSDERALAAEAADVERFLA